jgi:hypothetical protein
MPPRPGVGEFVCSWFIDVFVCAAAPQPRRSPRRSLVYVLLLCDSVAAALRPPRQARIRAIYRVLQAAAVKAREARQCGGGTSFPPVDM